MFLDTKPQKLEIKRLFTFLKLGSAHDYNWDDGFIFDGERHIAWEIVYVVSGCVRATKDEKVYELYKGDMIIHAPMEFHTIRSWNGTSPHVYITSSIIDGSLPHNLTEGVFSLTKQEAEEYESIFSRIYTFRHEKPDNILLGQEAMDSLSSFLINLSINHQAEEKLVLSPSSREYNAIIKAMEEHIYDNCTLEDIARYTNTSVSNIKVLFRKYCGISPKLYYARLRCDEAINLLAAGYTAIEVSNRLHFSSPNYFNTFFKRMTGKPPKSYNKTRSK